MSYVQITIEVLGMLLSSIFSFCITFALLHFYMQDKDKRKLIFFLAFFSLSLTFLFLFIEAILQLEPTILSTNFHQWSSMPILLAVFFAANDMYIKIKRFDNIILFFSFYIIFSYGMVFIPIDITVIVYSIRMAVAIEILAITTYIFIKTKHVDQLHFLFAVICLSIAGMASIGQYVSLSIFAQLMALVFFSLIFFTPSSKKNGVGAFFKLQKELQQVKSALNEKEETFQTLFKKMADPVIIIDKKGMIIEVTDKVKDYIGYDKKEIIGTNYLSSHLLSKKSKELCKNNYIKRMKGIDIKPYEVEILTNDGNKKFFEINAQQIMYNNQPADLIVLRDLSDRKKRDKAEKKLLRESLFLSKTANELNSFPVNKNLYEYIGETIHEISGNSIVIISTFNENNQQMNICKAFGIYDDISNVSIKNQVEQVSYPVLYKDLLHKLPPGKLAKVSSEEVKDIFSKIVTDDIKDFYNKFINKKQIYQIGLIINDQLYGVITILALRESLIENKKIIETFTNQSIVALQRNKAMKKLSEMNDQLEEKVKQRTKKVDQLLRQKDEFIHQLGHDLKNPLGPLVNLLPILEKKETDPKKQEMLQVINRNVGYMKKLVQKTLELARLNSASFTFHLMPVKLYEKIEEVISKNALLLKEKQLSFSNLVSKDIIVQADQLRLEELLTNLLTNAIKYSDANGSIEIAAEKNRDRVIVTVKDYGIGMDNTQMESIFNEFYKVDGSRHDFESSGLGLPICKRIVEKHGGRIWVESEGIEKGSTFYFTLLLDTSEGQMSMDNHYDSISTKIDAILQD